MKYSREVLEEVRFGNDIVDVVSSYLPLKRAGASFVGLCPFHNEKTPSFSVSPDRQMFYCFGCGASGNVYGFVMRIENAGFIDALTLLAERIRYTLPEKSHGADYEKAQALQVLKERLYNIHKISARFFYENLQGESGRAAVRYLDERGVSAQIRTRFGLGFGGLHRGALMAYLLEKGFEEDVILQSGLILPGKKGGYYERFFGRLLFPIFDGLGKVVGFGGRALGEEKVKYINSPDTPIFGKSHNLYGVNLARKAKTKTFLLVEGYMDVLAMHQAGFTNTVAVLGTAFNEHHAANLKRYVKDVILAMDSDDAGQRASLRAVDILDKAGIGVRVLTLQDAKDPDEFIKKFGREAFLARIAAAGNHIAFQVAQMQRQFNLTKTEEKVRFTKEVSKLLAARESPVERDAYAQEAAELTGIAKESIKSEMDKLLRLSPVSVKLPKRGGEFLGRNLTKDAMPKERTSDAIAASLLKMMAESGDVCHALRAHLSPEEMGDAVYGQFLVLLYGCLDEKRDVYPAELLNHFEAPEAMQKAAAVFEAQTPDQWGEPLENGVNGLLRRLKIEHINKKIMAADAESVAALHEARKKIEKLYITIPVG